jgi:hypothetical protein
MFLIFGLTYGPIVVGLIILYLFGDNKSIFWPFHKTKLFGGLGFHLIVSFIMVVYPVQKFAEVVLLSPGDRGLFEYSINATGMMSM